MVVVFPIQVFGHVIKNLDGSGFSHPNFLGGNENSWMVMIHYLKNKVGVVDFANAQGVVMF